MARTTKHDYALPGSRERVDEAYIALLDTPADDDEAWHRNASRRNAALEAYVRRRVREIQRAEKRRRPFCSHEQPALPFRRET